MLDVETGGGWRDIGGVWAVMGREGVVAVWMYGEGGYETVESAGGSEIMLREEARGADDCFRKLSESVNVFCILLDLRVSLLFSDNKTGFIGLFIPSSRRGRGTCMERPGTNSSRSPL